MKLNLSTEMVDAYDEIYDLRRQSLLEKQYDLLTVNGPLASLENYSIRVK